MAMKTWNVPNPSLFTASSTVYVSDKSSAIIVANTYVYGIHVRIIIATTYIAIVSLYCIIAILINDNR